MRTIVPWLLVLGLLACAGCPTGDDDAADDDTTGDDDTSGDDDSATPLDADGDGWTVADGDCDDSDPAVHPDAVELCNGADDDCDGAVDEASDGDGDGVTSCGPDGVAGTADDDCDDADAATYPGAAEVCDGADNDCDGDSDEGLHDDQDGDGFSECDGDCDDSNPDAFPGPHWEPSPDGVDANCDGADAVRSGTAPVRFVALPDEVNSVSSVAMAGDVNGDGFDDVLIGAAGNDEAGYAAGKVYLMLGSTVRGGGEYDLAVADSSFLGENSYDFAGTEVSAAGDVDGDGLDDILISAGHNGDGGPFAGKTYLYYGASLQPGVTHDLADADVSIVGTDDDESGTAIAAAGDVDGDGFDDVLIGAPGDPYWGGVAYLALGSFLQNDTFFPLLLTGHHFHGEADDDRAGQVVAAAGDVDGDGLADILIGASHNDDGGDDAGKVYLWYGATIVGQGTWSFDLGDADVTFTGEVPGDHAYLCNGGGDVDGDGLADLIIGSPWNSEGVEGAGKSYLFLASAVQAGGSFDLAQADAAWIGEQAQDGSKVYSPGGDVDGDGLADLFGGAGGSDEWQSNAGKVYLLLGSSIQPGSATSLSDADGAFVCDTANDYCGNWIAGGGDVDGDGLDDLLVGLVNADDTATVAVLWFSPY